MSEIELSRTIRENSDLGLRARQGKVVSIQVGPPRSLTVLISGTNYAGVRVMDHVDPTVNEGVWLLDMGAGRWLCIGTNSSSQIRSQFLKASGDNATGLITVNNNVYLGTDGLVQSLGAGSGYIMGNRDFGTAGADVNLIYRIADIMRFWNTNTGEMMSLTDAGLLSVAGQVNSVGRFQRNGADVRSLISSVTAQCSAQLTPTTTTMADVTGATTSPTLADGDLVVIHAIFACGITANNGVVVGAINVAGTDQAPLGSYGVVSSVAPQGGSFSLYYAFTQSGAGAVTMKLRGRMGAGGSASAANINTNTTINVQVWR